MALVGSFITAIAHQLPILRERCLSLTTHNRMDHHTDTSSAVGHRFSWMPHVVSTRFPSITLPSHCCTIGGSWILAGLAWGLFLECIVVTIGLGWRWFSQSETGSVHNPSGPDFTHRTQNPARYLIFSCNTCLNSRASRGVFRPEGGGKSDLYKLLISASISSSQAAYFFVWISWFLGRSYWDPLTTCICICRAIRVNTSDVSWIHVG